jgi:hypothetical protein
MARFGRRGPGAAGDEHEEAGAEPALVY